MLIIEEHPKWIAEGDCPHCGAHSKAVVPENANVSPGQQVEMRCINCKKIYPVILPPKPSPTITMKP